MEDRLIELETRIAFQEDTLSQLNEIVTQQQLTLDRVLRELTELRRMMHAITPSHIADASEETPPPHY